MDANLKHSERRGRRGVNKWLPGRIPATAVEPCPFAAEISIWFAAEPPHEHPISAPRLRRLSHGRCVRGGSRPHGRPRQYREDEADIHRPIPVLGGVAM